MKDVKRKPHSFTSNDLEATNAANGNLVYVIEVRVEKGVRSYWTGYKYRAFEKVRPAGGGNWNGGFKFKNAAKFTEPATGAYFDSPVRIDDVAGCEWLAGKQPGMAEMPPGLVAFIDAQFADPANAARSFA